MEAKRLIAFEYKKEDRIYTLEMPDGAPLGEAYEAAANFLQEMVTLINDHANKITATEEEKENSVPKES